MFDQGVKASEGVFGWLSWCRGPKGEFTANHLFIDNEAVSNIVYGYNIEASLVCVCVLIRNNDKESQPGCMDSCMINVAIV